MDSSPQAKETAKERKPLADLFRDAWSQALGAVGSAEEDVQKALHRVMDLPATSQEEARRVARDLSEKLVGQRKTVEQAIEQGVRRALSRATLPKKEEVDALRKRVVALQSRVDALTAARQRPAPSASRRGR